MLKHTLHNHFLLSTATGDDDVSRILQPPHDIDDLLLRRLDIAHPHRAHVLHVFRDKLGRALGHVLENLLLELFAGRLESQRQLLIVDLLEHRLNSLVVDQQNVLEDEHQPANLLDQIGILGLQAFHEIDRPG